MFQKKASLNIAFIIYVIFFLLFFQHKGQKFFFCKKNKIQKMSLYDISAQILNKLKEQKGTIKSLVLSNNDVKDKKSVYALVCQSLKCKLFIII
jgi:hypothetical protein